MSPHAGHSDWALWSVGNSNRSHQRERSQHRFINAFLCDRVTQHSPEQSEMVALFLGNYFDARTT